MVIGRELPDLADGMGAIERGVLRRMLAGGYTATRPVTRTATVIEELGLEASHDDVYAVLVALEQDFTSRYPLIEGHGNFGAPGFPPAEAQYTESRLSAAGMAAAEGRLPLLMANGAMSEATCIPPHNLAEVAAAAAVLLDDREAPLERLLGLLPAPDFPTGGVIADARPLADIYATGRGSFVLDARWHVEPPREPKIHGSCRSGPLEPGPQIVLTEFPYAVSPIDEGWDEELEEAHGVTFEIQELLVRGELPITDIALDSDRDDGVRLCISVPSHEDIARVIRGLQEESAMRRRIDVDLRVRVDGAARTVGLRELLLAHVDRRRAALGSDEAVRDELRAVATELSSPRRTTVAARHP